MIKKNLILAISFLIFSNISFSQVVDKEKVTKDGVDNNITISETGMYGGTESKEAKKYFDEAADYGNKKDYKNAEKYYLKAIKEDSKYVEAYDNLGLVYRRMEKYDKAIEYYKKSIKLYPNGITAHQNLASAYGFIKDNKSAIKEYEAIISIDSKDPEGYFGLANTYMMLSEFDKALKYAKKALEIYKATDSHQIGDGYYLVGLINYYKEDNKEAKKYLQKAKDNGAKIHPQIEEAIFGKEVKGGSQKSDEKDYVLKKKSDYAKYEEDVIRFYDWLLATPLGDEPDKRKSIAAFVVQWVSGTPSVTLELNAEMIKYSTDCSDCLVIFMGGWTKYALTTGDFKSKEKGNLAGLEGVITFYKANKKALGKNKEIEKLIKLQNDKKLKSFIKSNI